MRAALGLDDPDPHPPGPRGPGPALSRKAGEGLGALGASASICEDV